MKVYFTREFSRLARKQGIDNSEIYEAARRAEQGLVDATIGKFLIKQRIARKGEGRSRGFRAIVFHKQGVHAVFLHLFAKSDQGNLTNTEEVAYRDFAKELAALSTDHINTLVKLKKWIEIEP